MKASGWSPSPGHIIYARIAYSDTEGAKSRFAVVVSADSFNQRYPEVIVAYATRSSNVKHSKGYDVELSDRHASFRNAGLPESTTVRCGRLWTLNKRAIQDVKGVVPDDLMADIARLVRDSFRPS